MSPNTRARSVFVAGKVIGGSGCLHIALGW